MIAIDILREEMEKAHGDLNVWQEDWIVKAMERYAQHQVKKCSRHAVIGQLPLGKDMDGNQIFPNDIVLIDGDEDLPAKIEHGKYREKFDCGYIIGWYVPDYCRKVER